MPRGKVHGVLYEGPSAFDGSPIVAIATDGSSNAKTGSMIQVWILRADMSPMDAINANMDTAICGHCPLRGDSGKGRGCYVAVGKAPATVWKTWRAGKYRPVDPSAFQGRKVRLGAYGDPAMLPVQLVREVQKHARGITGYTHQWNLPFGRAFAGLVMASVETPAGEKKALSMGFGTFRAGARNGSDRGKATLCANEAEGIQCADCMACDGGKRAIYIPAHGFGASFVPAEALLRRKARAA